MYTHIYTKNSIHTHTCILCDCTVFIFLSSLWKEKKTPNNMQLNVCTHDKSHYGTRQEIIYNVILMGEITIIHDQRMHKTRNKNMKKIDKSYLI